METRFTVLLIELGVGIAIEIALFIAILMVVRRSAKRMESLADEFQRRALPTLAAAQELITNTKPKIEEIISNAAESTATLKVQIERLDSTVGDIVDRTRLHVIRADNLVGRTLDRVEETTEMVHTTVVSPIRQISGVLQGVTAGIASLLGRQLGVRKIITRVSRMANLRLFERVGIDVVLSARGAAVASLVHQIQGGRANLLAVLEEGQATIVELQVPPDYRPRSLLEIEAPPHSIVGAILRGNDVIVPRGSDELRPDDRLLVFATEQSVARVRDYFAADA